MKIKIICLVIVCLVGLLLIIFNRKEDENLNLDNNKVNLNDFNNSNFNF